MNCYNHNDSAANGICKNCHKAICKDCAVDVGDGLACQNSCEEQVKNQNTVFKASLKAYKVSSMVYKRYAVFCLLIGSFLLIWAFLPVLAEGNSDLLFYYIPLTVIFFYFGKGMLNLSKQIQDCYK
jgi:hypothetical protein